MGLKSTGRTSHELQIPFGCVPVLTSSKDTTISYQPLSHPTIGLSPLTSVKNATAILDIGSVGLHAARSSFLLRKLFKTVEVFTISPVCCITWSGRLNTRKREAIMPQTHFQQFYMPWTVCSWKVNAESVSTFQARAEEESVVKERLRRLQTHVELQQYCQEDFQDVVNPAYCRSAFFKRIDLAKTSNCLQYVPTSVATKLYQTSTTAISTILANSLAFEIKWAWPCWSLKQDVLAAYASKEKWKLPQVLVISFNIFPHLVSCTGINFGCNSFHIARHVWNTIFETELIHSIRETSVGKTVSVAKSLEKIKVWSQAKRFCTKTNF